MNFWLSIISDYQTVQISLCQKEHVLQSAQCDKHDSNKQLLTLIDTLLRQHNISLHSLDFIGVNAGPGPYTSLRVAISTANALSFATGIPLIGIDALLCLLEEHSTADDHDVIALLNAFNNEVFYGIKTNNNIQTGYIAVQHLSAVMNLLQNNITFIGNGVSMYRDQIQEIFPHITLPTAAPAYASHEYMIKHAWQQWCNKQGITNELFPLYLKELNYKNSITVK